MTLISIGIVARKTGIRASALRYYEELGVLPPPTRVSGRRYYGPEAVRRIDVLRFASAAVCGSRTVCFRLQTRLRRGCLV